jgi:hypothetical protein
MVRPERDTIGGEHRVEIDECLVGGKTRGEGRGVHHKDTVVGAVEVRARKPEEAGNLTATYAGRMDTF